MPQRTCSVTGCGNKFLSRGYCSTHYRRARDAGEFIPHRTAEERFLMKVQKTDTCWLWAAATNDLGYGNFYFEGRVTASHRAAYQLFIGPIGEGLEVDHICLVRNCVNPKHLRAVTRKQNMENLSGALSNSRSGIRGVYRTASKSGWLGQVTHEGRQHYVGQFQRIEDAEAAVVAKRLELFTHNELDKSA